VDIEGSYREDKNKMKAKKLTKETILGIDITNEKFPKFEIGDTIEVAQIIKEANKERIQMFAGVVIGMKNSGIASTFTVRRIGANNVAIEKIFPYFSPVIDNIKIVKKGDVRRAKLYYVRERIGRAARIKEKIETKKQAEQRKSKKKVTPPEQAPPEPEQPEKTSTEQAPPEQTPSEPENNE
jgi:large subunit ribosomal protein L19